MRSAKPSGKSSADCEIVTDKEEGWPLSHPSSEPALRRYADVLSVFELSPDELPLVEASLPPVLAVVEDGAGVGAGGGGAYDCGDGV